MQSKIYSRNDMVRSGFSHGIVLLLWVISLVLLFSLMILIFRFSASNSTESSGLSHRFSQKLITLFLMVTRGHMSRETIAHVVDLIETPVRKMAHFSEYALLGFLAQFHISTVAVLQKEKMKRKTYRWIAIIFCVLYAFSDEIHQYFVPGRACRMFDVCIDSSGVLTGSLFFLLIFFPLLDGLIFKGYNQKKY